MQRPVIFIDDGGVMNDPQVRLMQWPRLVAAFFVPRLGGTPEAWMAANSQVIARLHDVDAWQTRVCASPDYASLDRQYQIDWLRWMCDLAGVPAPEDEDCVALGHAAYAYITRQVRAAFPGAVDAIRTLRGQGYVMHTASGESSQDLDGYLRGMGVRECFERLYGPDLIDTLKDGPRFYERIFADAGIAPRNALVVDDNANAAGWAAQAGAMAVRIGAAAPSDNPPTLYLESLAELPAMIERVG